MPVDDDEAQRLGCHAAGHALGDQTVASPRPKRALATGMTVVSPSTMGEPNTAVAFAFLADCLRELGKLGRNVLLQGFRLDSRQTPHRSIS
jgi:hypothetical protein